MPFKSDKQRRKVFSVLRGDGPDLKLTPSQRRQRAKMARTFHSLRRLAEMLNAESDDPYTRAGLLPRDNPDHSAYKARLRALGIPIVEKPTRTRKK